MSRDNNRAQDQRAKSRARKILCLLMPGEEISPRRVGRRAATRTPCSCLMCGQARKMEGAPISERRAIACVDPKFD